MRPALAIVAALPLALGACSVNVEGAPCGDAVGTVELCPSGQACGLDGKCSTRAAGCITPDLRCALHEKRCSPQGQRVETCTASDPCGAWEALPEDPVCADGLACSAASGAPRCECPAFAGPEFAADPAAGSPAGAAPFATGASSPPQCRFRSLTDAISRAGQVVGAAAVRAYGASAAQVVFDGATGDGPVTIPANVTVTGATGAAATVLRAAAATGSPVVTLEGSLQRFAVEATGTGIAVATACGGATPSMDAVAVDGGGSAAIGVDVSGACGAALSSVDAANVAGPALYVHADPAAQVNVYGGAFRSSAAGVRVTGGTVTFGADGQPASQVRIAANTGDGIVLATGASVIASFYGTEIDQNGGTGVVVDDLSGTSGLTMRGCDVSSNGTAAPRTYGPGTSQRTVGGVLVAQGSIPLSFLANRIYANEGDQLAFESSATWTFGPSACGATSNVFACVPSGSWAVAAAGGGAVTAQNAVWPGVPIGTWLGPGVTGTYCNGAQYVPATPVCTTP